MFPDKAMILEFFGCANKLILRRLKYPKCDSDLEIRNNFVFGATSSNVRRLKRGVTFISEKHITLTLPELYMAIKDCMWR